MQLQLTWAGHSAIRIERDGFVLVIDPGVLSAPDAAVGASGLLISHQHLDHYDVSKIAAAVATRPGLPIWTNTSVAALLEQSGAGTGANVHVIGDGDAFEAGGIPVRAYGEWHAPIHDATLTTLGQGGEDAFFGSNPPGGPGTGVPYSRPAEGVPFEF